MKTRPRECNSARFISDTVAPIVASGAPREKLPVLGIDEGLNDQSFVEPMALRLVSREIVYASIPLWYQMRRKKDGELMTVTGSSLSRSPLTSDLGRAVRGFSCPDEDVIALLVSYFTSHDRLCLLTQNTKRNPDGLRWILEQEVGPAIEAVRPRQLGLLVLAQEPKTTLRDYCAAVEACIGRGISPGYAWEMLPGGS